MGPCSALHHWSGMTDCSIHVALCTWQVSGSDGHEGFGLPWLHGCLG